MKVAVIHYWFITRRGGEKVVESILKLYPQADVYTLFYDKEKYGDYLNDYNVYSSKYDNKITRKFYQKLFPFYPTFVRSIKLREDYDLIISSESGPAKGVFIKNNAPHICYIHSPMRYCWGFTDEYLATLPILFKGLANFFFKKLKKWDKTTVNNVNLYIANSKNVADRVKKYYNKNSEIIYPPIEKELFLLPLKEKSGNYFLSFGAITPYKKIDLLIECFNKNKEKLIIVGSGSEKEKLEKKANNNIDFKGFVKDKDLKNYILNAKALVFPGEEDFGMIPLEVMALGLPVIAFKRGGALETVIEDRENIHESSGLFFKNQTVKSLQSTINLFLKEEQNFDSKWIRNHALNFEEKKFLARFQSIVEKYNKN